MSSCLQKLRLPPRTTRPDALVPVPALFRLRPGRHPALPDTLCGRSAGMTLLLLVLDLATLLASPGAAETKVFPRLSSGDGELIVYSSTDLDTLSPAIADFQVLHPAIEITYVDLDTA